MIEQNRPLPEKVQRGIDKKITKAAKGAGKGVRVDGQSSRYYTLLRARPQAFRTSARNLVEAGWSDPSADQDKGIHPLASTAERGLVIGSEIAFVALGYRRFRIYVAELCEAMDQLKLSLGHSTRDLEDMLDIIGSPFVERLRAVDPVLVTLDVRGSDPEIQMRRSIYANSVGYVANHFNTSLVEGALAKEQSQDRIARVDMMDEADRLHDDAMRITTEDIPF